MKISCSKAGGLLLACLFTTTVTSTAADILSIGFAKFEAFNDIGTGVTVADLTGSDKFLNNQPDATNYIVGIDSPSGYGDNYGARVSGFIVATESGDFDFFLRSDDAAQLFISSNETPPDPLSDAPVAEETDCCEAFVEPGNLNDDGSTSATTTSPISLVAGQKYAFIALLKEGGGGDYVQVAMRNAEDTTPAANLKPIGGKNLAVLVPDNGAVVTISAQPATQSVTEGRAATLTVEAAAKDSSGTTLPIGYQWQRNGTDIPGATKSTLTTPRLQQSDSGVKYTVTLYTLGATTTSGEAAVTVVPDTVPPVVLSAGSLKTFAGGMEVGVIFDENLTEASATQVSKYSLDSGTVTAARFVSNSSGTDTIEQGVILTVTGITPGNNYTLTVNGVSDIKGNAMTTAQQVPFTASSFSWVSIGTVADFKPEAIATGTNDFNLVSGGNAYWGTEDDITMVYEEVSGDFDKKARIEFNDPSSTWARSGISARESLNNGAPTTDLSGENPASRYQMVISDPATQYDGAVANNSYETNRRMNSGEATSSSNAGGRASDNYPNSYVRLKRVGQIISMFYGNNGSHWIPLGSTDFTDPTLNVDGEDPLPDKLFVGPTFGSENGNIPEDSMKRALWATRFREYGNALSAQKARGQQTASIGLNVGSSEAGATLSPADVAGVDIVAQGNWNNIPGAMTPDTGPVGSIVEDKGGNAQTTSTTVDFTSANTWASTGPHGEENNQFSGPDALLMTGYLDTGAPSTTQVTIADIPTDLTSAGYDVWVYILGGTGGDRGGGYRITDANGTQLKDYVLAGTPDSPSSFTAVDQNLGSGEYGRGTYIVFTNLTASSIIVEATTDNNLGTGATPRAPINAIQLVTPSGLVSAPTPTIAIARSGTSVSITFTGKLQKADTVNGTYTDVPGGSSPATVEITGTQAFYRASN